MSKVTIVTATTGRQSLKRCIESVKAQTHKDIQHLIVVDGKENFGNALIIIDDAMNENLIFIPKAVGKDRWNGHRIYGAATYLADGEYIMYLDDDNTIDPDHVESCLDAIENTTVHPGYCCVYTLRKIVDSAGTFLCNDDCESLGPDYETVINKNDRLIDVNCYFMARKLAVHVSPIWYRKARDPSVMEVDRALVGAMNNMGVKFTPTGKYTVNYAMGGNALSVQPEFFKQGNARMVLKYPNGFPWRK